MEKKTRKNTKQITKVETTIQNQATENLSDTSKEKEEKTTIKEAKVTWLVGGFVLKNTTMYYTPANLSNKDVIKLAKVYDLSRFVKIEE